MSKLVPRFDIFWDKLKLGLGHRWGPWKEEEEEEEEEIFESLTLIKSVRNQDLPSNRP